MEMPKQEDVSANTDQYDVVLDDQPETIQPGLQLTGHTPREYPNLSLEYLNSDAELAVGAAHSVSRFIAGWENECILATGWR